MSNKEVFGALRGCCLWVFFFVEVGITIYIRQKELKVGWKDKG
jgi:hypothetical protein